MDEKYIFDWEIQESGTALVKITKGYYTIAHEYVSYRNGFLFDFRLMRALKKTRMKCERLNKKYEKLQLHKEMYSSKKTASPPPTSIPKTKSLRKEDDGRIYNERMRREIKGG